MPACGVGYRLGRRIDRRVRAEQGRGEIGDAQGQLRAEQFEDRPFWARRLATQPAGQPAQPGHLQCFDIDHQLRQLLADMALAPGRLLTAREVFCQLRQASDLRGMIAPACAAALEHQSRDRDFPALVQRPNQILLRNCHVLEEYLVEVPVAVEQDERAHGDARRLHVDQEIADALMFRRVGVGAHQEKAPIGEMRARRPYLLPVDDEVLASIDCAGSEAGEIAARVGLGIALAPQLVGAEYPRQVALLLLFGPPVDQGRTQQVQRARGRQYRGSGAEIFLVKDDLLHKAGAPPAIFLGPRDPDPAGSVHRLLPSDAFFERLAVRRHALVGGIVDADLRGQIRLEPMAEFGAECSVLGAVGEVHGSGPNAALEKAPVHLSFPRKRESRRAGVPTVALDPRFRGGDGSFFWDGVSFRVAGYWSKMSSGRNALTTMFGTSTSSLNLRST